MFAISPELAQELEAKASTTCLGIEIETSSTIRYVNTDVDVRYAGYIYQAKAFDITAIDMPSKGVSSITVTFDVVDTTIVALALNNELLDKRVTISLLALDDNWKVIDSLPLFIGFITDISITDTTADVTVQDIMYQWRDEKLNIHSANCIWRFKDPNTCKYSGSETWCDKTYDRCSALGNTQHFRGFRYLPDMQEKEIWWGRKPK